MRLGMVYLQWPVVVAERSKAKRKPKSSREAASVDQMDNMASPLKSFDEAAGDKPLNPFPHQKGHALQEECQSVFGSEHAHRLLYGSLSGRRRCQKGRTATQDLPVTAMLEDKVSITRPAP